AHRPPLHQRTTTSPRLRQHRTHHPLHHRTRTHPDGPTRISNGL
ncbi:MAG: hypothetical protein AVDCRST_MAG29-959, partial [uncultured Nocardioidaceae bacterium]